METKSPSPSGKYVFHIFPWEARMSLWVESPRLVDTVSGRSLLDFENRNWSLDEAQWLDEERVQLRLRRYPGDHSPTAFEVLIDCQQRQAKLNGKDAAPLGELEKVLEKEYLRCQIKPLSTASSQPARQGHLTLFLKRWFGSG